jgi:hypothetical protein
MLITVTEGALSTLLLTEIELFQLPATDNDSNTVASCDLWVR